MALSLIAHDYEHRVQRSSAPTADTTPEIISLDDDNDSVLKNDSSGSRTVFRRPLSSARATGPTKTLIVAPLTLLDQWLGEIRNKSKNMIRAELYYGTGKQDIGSSVDVVVTSYGTVVAECKAFIAAREQGGDRRKISALSSFTKEPFLYRTKWRRIFIDEAHIIKNASTAVAQACSLLEADSRWALTGTPVQNSLNDLYSIVKFLRHEPWNSFRWWKRVIAEPYSNGDKNGGLPVLRNLLKEIMLRRTKDMRTADGQQIVTLPPRLVTIERVELVEGERQFYSALMERSKRALFECDERRKYATAFTLLMRMRQVDTAFIVHTILYSAITDTIWQVCDHPFLVIGKKAVESLQRSTSSSSSSSSLDLSVVAVLSDQSDAVEQDKDFSEDFLMRLYVKLKRTIGSADGSPLKRTSVATDTTADSRELKRSKSYLGTVMNRLELFRSASNDGVSSTVSSLSNRGDEATVEAVVDFCSDTGRSQAELNECPICLEERPVEMLSITPCGHIFCSRCVKIYQQRNTTCLVCQQPVDPREVVSLNGLVGGDDSMHEDMDCASKSKKEGSSVDWRRWGDRLHAHEG